MVEGAKGGGGSGQLIIRYIPLPSCTYRYEHIYLMHYGGVLSSYYSASCSCNPEKPSHHTHVSSHGYNLM